MRKLKRSIIPVALMMMMMPSLLLAGILPLVSHPARHPRRDAKAAVHAAKKTIRGIGKTLWYL